MNSQYLCCTGGDFESLTIVHRAENAKAAIDWLETHGGGVFHNVEMQYKLRVDSAKP